MTMLSIFEELRAERQRQEEKFGDNSMASPSLSDLQRLAILVEEVGEVAHALNEAALSPQDRSAWLVEMRRELIQVAAVAVAWCEVERI